MKIWTVDSFTEKAYAGNPAAVTIVTEFPRECQLIAREMNLSETAFVKPLGKDHFHIRWFTPTVEVKLCGHATLAAIHILRQEGMCGNAVRFDSLSGELRAFAMESGYKLDFPMQPWDKEVTITGNFGRILQAVSVDDEDVIIEVADEESVCNYKFDLSEIMAIDFSGVIITAKGKGKYDFVSRYFCPKDGIDEDPVTGSAHCKLAYYWGKKLGKSEFYAYQASPRGGEVRLSIHGDRVYLMGYAVTILEGRLVTHLIPFIKNNV